MEYKEQLKDQRWKDRRREILVRDSFRCQKCYHKSHHNHVHHVVYEHGRMAWEYEDEYLITLCQTCHQKEHDTAKSIKDIFKSMRLSGLFWTDIKNKIKIKI